MQTPRKVAALVESQQQQERCIASKAQGTIIDMLRHDGRTACFGQTLEEVRARPGYEDAEVMPLSEWKTWKAERQDAPIKWDPVSEEHYTDALEALPPIDWGSRGFLLGEPSDHHALSGRPRFRAFLRTPDGLFISSRPITRHEWRNILTGGEA